MSKLKQVRLAHDLQQKRQELTAAEQEQEALRTRREDLEKRSNDAAEAIEEMTVETPAEDKAAVEAVADQLEAEEQQLEAEETANEETRSKLREDIQRMEKELEEMNTRAREAVKPKAEPTGAAGVSAVERKDVIVMENMNTRKVLGLTYEERSALFGRNEEVKGWLDTVRAWGAKNFLQRGVENGELMIPRVLLGLVSEQAAEASKLMKHLDVRNVPGQSRVLIDGALPEAVWTEACAKLNELDLGVYMTELDGYKVGGYVPVCNALLEDATDPVSIGTEIVTKLGRSIGYAQDKATLFGTGNKMPMGIVTRINQTEDPGTEGEKGRPWVNLKATNYTKVQATTPEAFFSALVGGAMKASGKYSRGGQFWTMNERTKGTLMTNAVMFNAAGSIVAGIGDTMPVVGGAIEVLDFVPDGMIVGGYGSGYVLAQRAGTSLGRSEHVRFIEDQTVFRGTARYDGKPVIPEAFAVIGLGADVLAALNVTFAQDKANA